MANLLIQRTCLGCCIFFCATAAMAGSASTQPSGAGASSPSELTSLSLEDLMNVTVNSVSKSEQKISQAAAAVTVINQDQIQRSGLNSIPDLLRLVPGLDVARIDASTWAISSRGFNNQLADKLLVLMDGRTIYDPLDAGVFWDMQDYVLDDLDKIEVIRGPGATLWGANAVNGVINITTKSARDTQGLLVDGVGGTEESDASVRYGGKIDGDTYYRVYGKFRDFNDFRSLDGDKSNDGWQSNQSGFRIDRYPDQDSTWTVQGDIFYDKLSDNSRPGSSVISPDGSGGNVLARFTHNQSPDAGVTFQAYYDNSNIPGESRYHRDTGDADFQQRFPIGSSQEFTWGLGLRGEWSSTDTSQTSAFEGDGKRNDHIASSFAQDDLTLIPDRIHLIVGSKFSESSYDQFQAQPSVRVLFTPDARNTFWGAVSRALRSPSMDDLAQNTPIRAIGGPGTITVGNPDIRPEELWAYETGYRSQLSDRLTFDAAAFYDQYRRLVSNSLLPDGDTTNTNDGRAWSTGVELAANYRVTPAWRLEASYSYLFSRVTVSGASIIDDSNDPEDSPKNQAQLHSYWDITDRLQFNAGAYFVGRTDAAKQNLRLDLGLTWKAADGLQIGIGGQDLLQRRHSEFNNSGNTEPVPRSFYGFLRYNY